MMSFDDGFVNRILKIPGVQKLIVSIQQRKNRHYPGRQLVKISSLQAESNYFYNRNLYLIISHGTGYWELKLSSAPPITESQSEFSDDSLLQINQKGVLNFVYKDELCTLSSIDLLKDGWTRLNVKSNVDKVYGMGEKSHGLNKNGETYAFWNIDNSAFSTESDPLYISVPFAVFVNSLSSQVFGIFIDFPGYQQWTCASHSELLVHSRDFSMVLLYGDSVSAIISRFVMYTGKPFIAPLWALGYHQCRWTYATQEKVLSIAQTFREKQIPLDCIWLDIDYMDGYRCFTVDKTRFPNMQQMNADLAELGVKSVAIVDPGIKIDSEYSVYMSGKSQNVFCKSNGEDFVADVWPGSCHFPDFFSEHTLQWWADQYKFLIELGICGFWNDMNEPSLFSLAGTMQDDVQHSVADRTISNEEVHNLYGLKMVEGTYRGCIQHSKGRPFILSRSGYAGLQKFAWVWTGDNEASWEHLRMSIPKLLNLGLSGLVAGADIGGFRHTPSPQLYARWIQLGVFYPFVRTHTATQTADQEPWSFGAEVEAIARQYINLRYKLLPYIYTWYWQYVQTGIPLMRPMFLDFADKECYDVADTQFMFGPDLLIAPILYENSYARDVYLPRGDWYNFTTSQKLSGGKVIHVAADLTVLPIFVRANTVIPICKKVGRNAIESFVTGVDVLHFGDRSARGYLYLDDEVSYNTHQLYQLSPTGERTVIDSLPM